jgi:hypothetical protein
LKCNNSNATLEHKNDTIKSWNKLNLIDPILSFCSIGFVCSTCSLVEIHKHGADIIANFISSKQSSYLCLFIFHSSDICKLIVRYLKQCTHAGHEFEIYCGMCSLFTISLHISCTWLIRFCFCMTSSNFLCSVLAPCTSSSAIQFSVCTMMDRLSFLYCLVPSDSYQISKFSRGWKWGCFSYPALPRQSSPNSIYHNSK